jgi:hypothetical protein
LDTKQLRDEVSGLVAASADKLAAFQEELMDSEIAEGWRCFYARQLWLREALPEPLINEAGRRYMVEAYRQRILLAVEPDYAAHDFSFLERFEADAALRAGYRNYLETGVLDIENPMGSGGALDTVANDTVNSLAAGLQRHMAKEVQANAARWLKEASERATLTPPSMLSQMELGPAVRDASVPPAEDTAYWRALYWDSEVVVADPQVVLNPDWTLRLMAALAPDFPYNAALSTAKRLVFAAPGDTALRWAVMIEKPDGAPDFRYPPSLLLVPGAQTKKLKDSDIVFKDVPLTWLYAIVYDARSIELQLRYFLERCRRLAGFYALLLADTKIPLRGLRGS